MFSVLRSSSVVAVLLLTCSAAAAQTALDVRVTDPDRGAVTGAGVVLTPQPAGAPRTEATGADGVARFTRLTPGEYRLEVTAPGFGLHAQSVTLAAGSRTLDVTLEVGGVREEVTVEGVATVPTIGRINAPLSDQPLTVNTLTSEFLESNAINDLVTALKYVPNVATYSQYGVYQFFSFRGFTDSVQLVDGIRNEGNRVNLQLSNVDRIEVLKGPSSVLYGGDALGAAVNIVLKKPSADPAYEGSVTAGRWDTYRGAFGMTGRAGDSRLLYRIDTGAESATNFRHDPSDRFSLTPSMAWSFGGAGRLDARYLFERVNVSGDSGIPMVPLVAGFTPDPERTAVGDPLARAVQGDGTDVIPRVPRDSRYNTPQDFGLGTDHNLRVSYSQILGGRFAFRDTVGYRRFDDEYFIAEFLDVTPPRRVNRGFLFFKHHRYPVMNQADVTGQVRAGVDHNLLLGWDYQYYPNQTHRRGAANFNTTPMDLFDRVETHVPVNVHAFPVTRRDYQKATTNGLFFQDTLTLVPQLKVVLGGRYDMVDREAHNNPVSASGVETQGPVTTGTPDAFTHRVGLVYQPRPAYDVYAQNSTSFKPNFTITADGSLLKPEEGVQYEAGQRVRLLGDRLQWSSAVYQTVRRNVSRALGGGLFEQIGKQRARGVETELSGTVTEAWRVHLGYGFNKATFLDYRTGTGAGVNLSGNTPRRAPEHTLAFSTTYSWARGLSVSFGGQIVSEQFINDNNTVAFSPYELLDAGVSYRRGRIELGLNLTNVTDREYWTSSLGNRQLYPGQPFNLLATVRVRSN
jgi:iron complex outermembrane receptor protein